MSNIFRQDVNTIMSNFQATINKLEKLVTSISVANEKRGDKVANLKIEMAQDELEAQRALNIAEKLKEIIQ